MNTQHRWARQWAFPLIFLLLATFFRFYRLDQLPPGLFHDEAFNGLDAQRLLRDGTFALFFPDNQGREPLHIYLQAGAMALLGQHPWSMRLVSAFVGVLAVGLIYRLGQALFPDKTRLFSVGTVAAFSLALSYWHVHHSRIALRAVFLVPLTAAALWFFWRGYQRQRWREFVWGGMALGISLYTYLPARLVPLIIVGFVGWHLSLSLHPKTAPSLRPKTIWLLKGSALMLLVALLVFAPLGIYFLTHPDYFLQRTGSVSILAPQNHLGQSTLSALATNTATVLGMFFFKGDVNPLLNLPGRPALDGVFAAAFLIGLLFALLQLKQPAYALLLIWFGVMLLPTLLSNQAPHFLRSIGILPPLTVFTGLGLHRLGGYLTYFLPQYRRYLWPALVGITFLSSGWFTYRDYFQHWATLPEVTDSFHTAEYMVGTNLVALSHTYDVLLPADVYEYPGTAFVINAAFEQITLVDSLAESRPLVFLHPSDQCRLQPIMVRFRGISETTGQVSRVDTARADVTTWVTGPLTRFAFMDNLARPLVIAAHLLPSPQENESPPIQLSGANFAYAACLLGYRYQSFQMQAHAPLHLTLYWEEVRSPGKSWENLPLSEQAWQTPYLTAQGDKISLYLIDTLGQRFELKTETVATIDQEIPSEIVTQNEVLLLPGELIPGKYFLQIELNSPAGRVPLVNVTDMPVGDHVRLDNFTVYNEFADLQPLTQALESVVLGEPPLIQLLGYNAAATGHTLTLRLNWQALAPIPQNYTVFIHVMDENGQLVAQRDSEPMEGRAPTTWWRPQEIIYDTHTLLLPPELPPGSYTIAVGMYDWLTGQRLPLWQGDRLPDDRLLLPTPLQINP